jgi:hypothetical protein
LGGEGLIDWSAWGAEIPGQEFVDAVDGMVGATGQHGALGTDTWTIRSHLPFALLVQAPTFLIQASR